MAGDAGLDLYHRTLLLALMVRATGLLPRRDLPEEIDLLYAENFGRIMHDIESSMELPTLYLYPNSPFCKDLALCTLRLIPAGVEKVHASRLPRRMFVTGGLRGALDALRFALPTRRGLGPYYQMHLHSQDAQAMRAFNPRGWVEFYLRVAELLRRNPGMKGVFGASWFRDPALAGVSPHLRSLTTMVTDHGARLFPLGPCGTDGIRDATAKSATRRRLYEGGKYTPMNYLLVWPREELLAWADAGPALDAYPGEERADAVTRSGRGGLRHVRDRLGFLASVVTRGVPSYLTEPLRRRPRPDPRPLLHGGPLRTRDAARRHGHREGAGGGVARQVP